MLGTSFSHQVDEEDAELDRKIAELEKQMRLLEKEKKQQEKSMVKLSIQHNNLTKQAVYGSIVAKLAMDSNSSNAQTDELPKSAAYLAMRKRIDARKGKTSNNSSHSEQKKDDPSTKSKI